ARRGRTTKVQDRFMTVLRSIIMCGIAMLATPISAQVPAPAAIYASPSDQYLSIDGTRIRVRIEGPVKAPPIILIHGFSFSLESWDAWAADLARDHRVIRFDLAGHGLSDAGAKGRYATADRVRQLVALMDRLNVRRATIAGNSYGGLVAWNLAAQHPRRVD